MIEFDRHPAAGTPAIGEYWEGQGGIYAGIMPDYIGISPYHLVLSTHEAVDVRWGPYGVPEDKARSEQDGYANTEALTQCEHRHEAARWAAAYQKDGRTDFYLPAQRELEMVAASVPAEFSRSKWYWSSTENTAQNARGANFNGVEMRHMFKSFAGHARAVRRIYVS